MVKDYRRRFFVSLAVTVPILVLSPMIQSFLGWEGALAFPGDIWVLLGLSTVVYSYGGWPFLTGLVDELKEKEPGMMTLVGLAVSVAYIYSAAVALGVAGKMFFWETATLIDLMLVGHWIEMRSVMGASRALEELARLMPNTAHRITESGDTEEIKIADLRPGDRIRVKSGEKIPADGSVIEGRSSINESMLTGESVPVEKTDGDDVIAGSVNGTGSLVVEVTKTGEDSYLNQVISLVREAQASQSRTQNLADRAASWLTLIAITAGGLTFGIWFGAVDETFVFSLERAVTVMVITCPHALGLAIPLVVAVSTGIGAQRGLLIRDRSAFERARDLDTVVFDKTGTLTEGRFGVTDILVFGDASETEVLRLAAAVERHSEHPIAAGVLRSAEDRGIDIPDATDFEAITGKGVHATVEGAEIRVLSPVAAETETDLPEHDAASLGEQGKTVVYVLRGDTPIGALALADVIRSESKEAIQTLHDLGIDVVMLTGDNERVANWVAAEIGVDRVIAEVLPDQKNDVIEELKASGRIVAMTGDGVNDAPALASADVGMAIGAGTDVAAETADIVLVDSDPRDAVNVIRLARSTYQKMVQNLWWATGYNVVAIPLAAGVGVSFGLLLSPAAGAVLMSLSTVIVAVNARFLSLD
ncbi:copper-translocating P-type ATPase [Longibacter salinarum]|uniref:Copper-translocating P-type ATPase n=2 Tax=Longibacter salinarum TaxID=1850348 RepID=A0A2A8CUE6_9BACT|nr:copper-translocating P-type ATPase [Longibacter salinarum]